MSVWWDFGLEAGESYRAQITAELANASVVAPLWCTESIHSPWVRMEAELGKDKLVPARLQKVVPPHNFEAIQSADLIGWDGAVGNPRLLEFVRLICKRLGRSALAPTDMVEELGQLPAIKPLPEVAQDFAMPSGPSTAPAHDYVFWERQWDKHSASQNLSALTGISEEAPRYFAEQARARIQEIKAAQVSKNQQQEHPARKAPEIQADTDSGNPEPARPRGDSGTNKSLMQWLIRPTSTGEKAPAPSVKAIKSAWQSYKSTVRLIMGHADKNRFREVTREMGLALDTELSTVSRGLLERLPPQTKLFYGLPLSTTASRTATAASREWCRTNKNDHWIITGDDALFIAWRQEATYFVAIHSGQDDRAQLVQTLVAGDAIMSSLR